MKNRRQRRLFLKAHPTDLQAGTSPNDLWCIDFKGHFKTIDDIYCYPLTISDYYSRFLLGCEALDSTKSEPVFSSPLYGETVGFKEKEDRLWEIHFMDYFLGVYDEETNQFTPLA